MASSATVLERTAEHLTSVELDDDTAAADADTEVEAPDTTRDDQLAALRDEFPGAADEALLMVLSERHETAEQHKARLAQVRKTIRGRIDALRREHCHTYVSMLSSRELRRVRSDHSNPDARARAWADLTAAHIRYAALGGKLPLDDGVEHLTEAERAEAATPPSWVTLFQAGKVNDAARELGLMI